MGKFSQNAIKVKDYVVEHEAEHITAAMIAEGTGLGVRSVNAILTAAFTNHKEETGEEVDGKKIKEVKPLMVRVPGELEITEDGKTRHEKANFIEFTDYGRTFDYDA